MADFTGLRSAAQGEGDIASHANVTDISSGVRLAFIFTPSD